MINNIFPQPKFKCSVCKWEWMGRVQEIKGRKYFIWPNQCPRVEGYLYDDNGKILLDKYGRPKLDRCGGRRIDQVKHEEIPLATKEESKKIREEIKKAKEEQLIKKLQ